MKKKKAVLVTTQAPRCPNHLNRRVVKLGVCLACYNTGYARIRRGLTTLEEAREQGLIGPPGKRGRPLKKLKAAF